MLDDMHLCSASLYMKGCSILDALAKMHKELPHRGMPRTHVVVPVTALQRQSNLLQCTDLTEIPIAYVLMVTISDIRGTVFL